MFRAHLPTLLTVLLGLSACQEQEPTPAPLNLPPQVDSVAVNPGLQALPGDVLTLSLETSDPEGEAVTVSWSALSGSFEPSDSPNTRFTVPDALGPLELTLTLTDASGQQSEFSLVAIIGYQPIDDEDDDGFTWQEGDCNDLDPTISPMTVEYVDGKDNNCNGYVDEGSLVSDDDGDRWSEVNGDCNDEDPDIHPTHVELLDNKDNDCDGFYDEDTTASDDDGDGFRELDGDCNDARSDVYPNAPEKADGQDNNCNGQLDEGTVYGDDDLDGFSEAQGDCHDDEPLIYPQAPELTDGLDNNCNGMIDEGSDGVDDDGDGYTDLEGDCNDTLISVYPSASEQPDGLDNNCNGVIDEQTVRFDDDQDGFSEVEGDCDDADPSVYPGAPELSDQQDNDCDAIVDEGTPAYDQDGDGVSSLAGDCDDSDPMTFPGASEYADGQDNDCDNQVDEGTLYFDDDGDSFTEAEGDCNDSNPSIYPGAEETLNGLDDNCDGIGDPNQPPVAAYTYTNPGTTCAEITLDGSSSFDPDGDPLKYAYWYVASTPSGSKVNSAWFEDAQALQTSLVTDLAGAYQVGLIVSDGTRSSEESVLQLSVVERGYNQDPIAEAGTDLFLSQTVKCSYTGKEWVCPPCSARSLTFDGGASADPDEDRLFYLWSVASTTATQYTFSETDTAEPLLELSPPLAEYQRSNNISMVFKLEVRDCKGEKDVDTLVVSYTCTGI
ncbi:MAG: MopE-related protein [Myxococcota bacterium]